MSRSDMAADQKLLELRRSFDEAFAVSPRAELESMEGFIGLRISGDAFALRVSEVGHLASHQKIVALPSERPELLGLTGIRGTTVPVYSIARLLGFDTSEQSLHWLVTCGSYADMAMAFETFEGYFRVPVGEITRVNAAESARRHVHELVRDGTLLRAVVDMVSITKTVMNVAHRNDKA